MVRYCLNRSAKELHLDDGAKVPVPFGRAPVFVDVLSRLEEGACWPVRVRAFFPDGQIHVGTVVGFGIELFNRDDLFDGRFNADRNQGSGVRRQESGDSGNLTPDS